MKKQQQLEGKDVVLGLDVHRSFFVASCICEGDVVTRCRMPPTAQSVLSLIGKEFRGATVRTCYEPGYSGFWLHRALTAQGVSNIVVHAAAVEVSARDRVKSDKGDSLKIGQQLAAGRLRGIRIETEAEKKARLLTRTRRSTRSSVPNAKLRCVSSHSSKTSTQSRTS